jgi:hypothetical protein
MTKKLTTRLSKKDAYCIWRQWNALRIRHVIKSLAIACMISFMMNSNLMAQEQYIEYFFPNPDELICIVEADQQMGKIRSGQKLSKSLPFVQNILDELNHPFHRSVIKLNQCSRNFIGDKDGPNVLFLAPKSGGASRHGLVLTENEKSRKYRHLRYVEWRLNAQQLERGGLYIFSHELGHVMMNNIWSNFFYNVSDNRSSKPHLSMGITDYYMAFSEGWGVHFQRLTEDHIAFYRTTFDKSFAYNQFHKNLQHSNVDRLLRSNGVLHNAYIYQKILPAGFDLSKMSAEELIFIEHTSPLFDISRLKNAQQMLSCEGVIATLFYHINTNDTLQNHYLEKEFYNQFLLAPLPDDIEPQEVFVPYENVVLKHFWIWHQLREKGVKDRSRFTAFIEEWCEAFPEDKEELLKLFIMLTARKTLSNEPGAMFEKMAFYGMMADMDKYRTSLKEYNRMIEELLQKVLRNEIPLDANVGPQLWLVNKDFTIRTSLWSNKRRKQLSVNLNTATAYELATFSGISLVQAKELVGRRDEFGYFKSYEDAEAAGFKPEAR